MRLPILLALLVASCVRAGVVHQPTPWERLDRRGFFNECLRALAERGIPLAPPPSVVATEKQIGLGAYQPLPRRVLLPPPRPTAAQARQLFQTISMLMTGGKWRWQRFVPDDRAARLIYRFHIFGLLYQGLVSHLQAKGILKPGRITGPSRYDAERVGTRARVAFLRYYAERVEPRLRRVYRLYAGAIRALARRLEPSLAKLVALPPSRARRYWARRGRWLTSARSGQRVRGAFIVTWMAADLRSVTAATHVRGLSELQMRR